MSKTHLGGKNFDMGSLPLPLVHPCQCSYLLNKYCGPSWPLYLTPCGRKGPGPMFHRSSAWFGLFIEVALPPLDLFPLPHRIMAYEFSHTDHGTFVLPVTIRSRTVKGWISKWQVPTLPQKHF